MRAMRCAHASLHNGAVFLARTAVPREEETVVKRAKADGMISGGGLSAGTAEGVQSPRSIQQIKQQIETLAREGKTVSVRVSLTRPKIRLENVAVKVIGAYANIFRIEAVGCTPPKYYSLQYTDVLIGQIVFTEGELS